MKKLFFLMTTALMSVSVMAYENTSATFTWAVGNEKTATVASDAQESVKETKRTVGAGLTEGSRSNLGANNGVTMVTYTPAENKPGTVATAMVEYSVKMKNGITFTLTAIDYDAIKQGTDGASYHWAYAVDGTEYSLTEVPQGEIVRDNNTTGTPALHHTHTITAAEAGQTVSVRFYVSGFAAGKLLCLSQIVLTGTVNGEEEVRSFTDFKVDFRTEEPTWVQPTTQPTNVTLSGLNYHGNQHGIQAGTITVNVDGPVKFTLGGCQYGNNIAVQKDGADLTTIDNKVGCDNSGVDGGYNKFATWTYNVEEAAVLTFTVHGFLPYFFAEACDFVPQVEVRYYDVDGKTLIGSETVDGGSTLSYAYGAEDVTVAEGEAFRGWFNATVPTATKVAEGTSLTEDLNLYAKATDVEVAALGKIFDYDFRPNYFYPEDHEVLIFSGNHSYNGTQHGRAFSSGSSLGIKVAGNALLAIDVCTYSATGTVEITDAENNKVGELTVEQKETTDGSKQTVYYEGEATTLTLSFTATNYIHHIKVYNIAALPTKDEQTGYYILAPGDGAGLKLVLESIQSGEKIFLPNGVYDFGEDALTQISKDNISIIGESMEGTIIRNAPDFHNEGIGTTATLLITGNNTYLQDLTLENAMDYFKALATLNNGRAVCLQDKGTKTVCKNVRMLSRQDTYYSNKVGAVKYFEDCEIHGTVDFICGDGSVYFKNNELVGEQRNASGGGANAITASNAATEDRGYVFESCRVRYAENIEGTKPVMSFGRSWNNAPKCVFLNTELADDLIMTKDASAQKDKIDRWHLGAMNALPVKFGEYKSVDATGTIVSPTSHKRTFVYGSAETEMETILSDNEAATYTIDYTLGDWAAEAQAAAKQEPLVNVAGQWQPTEATVFLVKDGEAINIVNELPSWKEGLIVRAANARGGFGAPAEFWGEGIEDVQQNTPAVEKRIVNGQLLIIKNGKAYNALGAHVQSEK